MKNFDYSKSRVAEISDPIERRIMAALKASKIGVFEFEPQTDTAFWDDRVRELWGIRDANQITYEVVVGQVHPDDRALHDAGTAQALDPNGDGRMDMTYRLFPKDGGPMRWIKATAECLFRDGVAVRLVGTVSDVTDERSAVEHNKLLINELQHRVKNTLATAVAVVGLSRRGCTDINQYFEAVDERLRNLSTSHDLLRQSEWSDVHFQELFSKAAESFLGARWKDHQITLNADALQIPAQHVMTLSIALHELMTNAAKHGALSVTGGKIEVTVTQEPTLWTLIWTETGGPVPKADPKNTGFGHVLLEEILPNQVHGTADASLDAGGYRYVLTFPPFKIQE